MGNISKNLAIISIILSCLVVVRILMQDRSITYTEEVIKSDDNIPTVIYGDSVRVIPKSNKHPIVYNIDLSDTMVFYINTDSLDNDSNILDWYVDDGELYIYTKQDSINDEIERWNYIRSLDPEGWEE